MGRFSTVLADKQFDPQHQRLKQIIGDNCFNLLAKLPKDLTDDQILTEFAKIEQKMDNSSYNTAKIRYLEPYKVNIKRILDFGGANGAIAGAMASEYKVPVDVVDVHDGKTFLNLPMTKYIKSSGKLVLDDYYSIVTCFMVLHHVPPEDLDQIAKQLIEHLDQDGYLIIQEHDCNHPILHALIDIQHLMYMFVWKDEDYDQRSSATYEAWYGPISKIAKLFDGQLEPVKFFRTNRITQNYVAIYKKSKPTRKLTSLVR
jgi:SAM-dependent methyltransferase